MVRSHTCEVIGKPNQVVPVSLLVRIPAVESSFTLAMIDVEGPSPPSSAGNKYTDTIMDVNAKYSKVIKIARMDAKATVKHLISIVTTLVCLRRCNQIGGST